MTMSCRLSYGLPAWFCSFSLLVEDVELCAACSGGSLPVVLCVLVVLLLLVANGSYMCLSSFAAEMMITNNYTHVRE